MTTKITARELLTYLYAECIEWKEDVDGEILDNGHTVDHTNHDVRISNALLEELIVMAGMPLRDDETFLQALRRASKEDMAAMDEGMSDPERAEKEGVGRNEIVAAFVADEKATHLSFVDKPQEEPTMSDHERAYVMDANHNPSKDGPAF